MTVQNGRCRDGGWEDAAGRWKGGRGGTSIGLPLFWTSPKERSKVTHDAAGLWKGWWRDGATEGLLKVVIFKEI